MRNVSLYLNDENIPCCVQEGIDYELPCSANNAENIYRISQVLKHDKSAEERVFAYFLDLQLELLAFSEVSHGTSAISVMNIKGILQRALLTGAVYIALVHNHPSGSLVASGDDIRSTRQILEACELLEIKLIDHVIISRNGFASMYEQQLI